MRGKAEEWFTRGTYHHSQFEDLKMVKSLKEREGLKLSVCLPTLNVADTVGGIIRMLREELVERWGIIDELAIIDSRSSDDTVQVAKDEGADVYFDDEILPEIAPARGKGEALWKSLFVLKGDIIAWIDSDIVNMHPRFVYGIIGPLLIDPEIKYVKGFYRRPIQGAGGVYPTGGGRVTELVVRPLLNLFYPDLSALIQPLSGEYAGRRSLLESIPFLTGYGVESGLLLDTYSFYGLDTIAQVDLEVREHANQPLSSLSRMAFEVMQAVFMRLERDGKVKLEEKPSFDYTTFGIEEGGYVMETEAVEVIERPPMRMVEEYRKARLLPD